MKYICFFTSFFKNLISFITHLVPPIAKDVTQHSLRILKRTVQTPSLT